MTYLNAKPLKGQIEVSIEGLKKLVELDYEPWRSFEKAQATSGTSLRDRQIFSAHRCLADSDPDLAERLDAETSRGKNSYFAFSIKQPFYRVSDHNLLVLLDEGVLVVAPE
jgi:hypothetical protein